MSAETNIDGAFRRRLRALGEVSRALGSTLEPDRLLDLILTQVTQVMEADRSTLFLLDDDARTLRSKIAQGDSRSIQLALGEGIAGWVAAHGTTLRIDDVYSDPRFNRASDAASGYRTETVLCAPMRGRSGQVVGVVEVLNRHGGPFTADDEELLHALAGQAALAIENSRLYEAMRRDHARLQEMHHRLAERVGELDFLQDLTAQIHSAPDMDSMLDGVLGRATERLGAEAGSILLRSGHGGVLHFRAVRGPAAGAVRPRQVPDGEGVAGWVASTGQPLVVNEPCNDPRFSQRFAKEVGYQPRNILCVPLLSDEGTLGSFELLSKSSDGGFTEDDLRLAGLIASRTAAAIQLHTVREDRDRESRLASIGQTLSGLLHDLKTPMTVISGHAQLLGVSVDASRRGEHSAQIQKQLEAMNTMVQEVLSFARGESTLLLRRVPLSSFLRDVEMQLAPALGERSVALVIEPGERGHAIFDEAKMMRLIQNLARNAAEAMTGGGTFRIGVQRDDANLLWTFADTGPGIPAEIRGSLFEMFASHGKADGTGLGLAIVKRIAEDHGGHIDYETSTGRGTTFTLRIPVVTLGGRS